MNSYLSPTLNNPCLRKTISRFWCADNFVGPPTLNHPSHEVPRGWKGKALVKGDNPSIEEDISSKHIYGHSIVMEASIFYDKRLVFLVVGVLWRG